MTLRKWQNIFTIDVEDSFYDTIFDMLNSCASSINYDTSNTRQLTDDVRKQNKYLWIYLLPAIFLLAFKASSVGADTMNYNRAYIDIRDHGVSGIASRIERGYVYFIFLLTRIFPNTQTQHIAVAIIAMIVWWRFAKNNMVSPARFVVLLMGFNLYSFYLSGTRQALAMLFCLCGYESIKKKKMLVFLFWTLVGFLFHKSALFFLPAYFMANWKPTKNKLWLYALMYIVLIAANEILFEYASGWFDIQYGIEEAGNGYIMIGLMAIITVLSFVRMKELLELDPNNRFLIPLNALHMGFWLLRLFSRTAERPSLFYTVFAIALVEQLILTVKMSRKRSIINAAVMLFFASYAIYKLRQAGLTPYRFFF